MALHLNSLDTPAVLIDVDRVEANLVRAQTYANANDVKLQPHVKTHKLPVFARRQIEHGAVGITCQKLGEAEVMADAGLDDVLLTYNIIGREKLLRLRALGLKTRLSVTADSLTVITGHRRGLPRGLR